MSAEISTLEKVVIQGNLSELSPDDRVRYYNEVCRSLSINPLTRPFDYITLNGKLQLYAKKDATDQLRRLYHVSIVDIREEMREGVYIVTVKAQDESGRTDMAKGAVNIAGLKGEALANAIMKAETKGKRRVTLSICGLGMLDETEVDPVQPQPRKAKAAEPKLIEHAAAPRKPEFISKNQWQEITTACYASGASWKKLLENYSVASGKELPTEHYDDALRLAKHPRADLMSPPVVPEKTPA